MAIREGMDTVLEPMTALRSRLVKGKLWRSPPRGSFVPILSEEHEKMRSYAA